MEGHHHSHHCKSRLLPPEDDQDLVDEDVGTLSSSTSSTPAPGGGSTSLMSLVDQTFLRSLRRDPNRRSPHDIQTIYYTLRSFDVLSRLEDTALVSISQTATYARRCANDILYCRGEIASSWYILLSGSVFIDGGMFLPIASFGLRCLGQTRRPNECLILEPSEMIVIDYVEAFYEPPGTTNNQQQIQPNLTYSNRQSNRNSHSSDTSSAYSGSDTMCSSVPDGGSDDMDLSGLQESAVDSDEEDDLADSLDSLTVRDAVRECLEKDPIERTEHDVGVLLEFTQHLAAFNDLTNTVRRALCQAMVFAVVERAGTVVLNDGEELDSWSVVVHGCVEVSSGSEGPPLLLSAGDSFGLPPTLDKQYFRGEMRTRTDDCQFVCVTQADYHRILKQGQDRQTEHRDLLTNSVILITEQKQRSSGGSGQSSSTSTGQIVIRGTLESLMSQLVSMENPSMDPTYVEDYLLTHRVFSSSTDLAGKLLNWFNDPKIKDRVTRTVLLWVNNHFIDFETNPLLMAFLQRFQSLLESSGKDMSGQLRLLQIACSAKSRSRSMTLRRPSREDPLPFNIMGGADNGYGIYISHVDSGGRGEELGLRPGDEVLEVNGVSFRSISLSRAFDLLKASTHSVLVVKCNFLGYHECLHSSIPLVPRTQNPVGPSSNNPSQMTHHVTTLIKQHKPLTRKERLLKTLEKIHLLPKSNINTSNHQTNYEDNCDSTNQPTPDPETTSNSSTNKIDFPENVLKIYRPDQTFKYFLVNRETTAREVVMLALQEFLDLQNNNSRDYALFQVSVTMGILKQGRLPDQLDSLAERIPLGSRYYIKRLDSTDPLIPPELMPEMTRESEVGILNLNPVELALQLTLEDYAIFRQIEMTEYIDDLFSSNNKSSTPSGYGTPNLSAFAELVNRETFWVVTEITKEPALPRRVQIIKRFIKVALQCRECRNFNSMFAIVSGLGHSAVSRLRLTWDKLNNKYSRQFTEMQELMDPSRNMGKYRSLLTQTTGQTPMIPFYPVVRKDLTFIDLGNSTRMDGLINFEKMRMVAKEIRSLVQMSAAPFDTSSQPTMAAMNQLHSTGTTGHHSSHTHLSGGGLVGSNHNQLTTTTGKRRKNKTNSPPNPKKMFEEMNMIRKVKAYLQKLVVIHDEAQLHSMSLGLEPAPSNTTTLTSSNISSTQDNNKRPHPGSTGAGASSSNRQQQPPGSGMGGNSSLPPTRRHPSSPTLSTSSSASSESTNHRNRKFGAGSPSSYHKLLALSETKTKIHTNNSSVQATTNFRHPPSPTHSRKLSSTSINTGMTISDYTMDSAIHHQLYHNHNTNMLPPQQSNSNSLSQTTLLLSTESSSVLPATHNNLNTN